MLTVVGVAALFLGPALVAALRGASFGVKLVIAGFGLCLAVLGLSAVASALTPLATRTSWAIESVQIVDTALAFAWLFLGALGVGAGAALGHLLRRREKALP